MTAGAPDTEAEEPQARVRCALPNCALVLEGPTGQYVLRYGAGQEGEERALPPGLYQWRISRVEVKQDDATWTLFSTRVKGEAMTLVAGETRKLKAPTELRFAGKARRDGRALQLGFSLTDEGGHGVSLYRDGRRVAVRFEVLDQDGAVIAKGAMRYG